LGRDSLQGMGGVDLKPREHGLMRVRDEPERFLAFGEVGVVAGLRNLQFTT